MKPTLILIFGAFFLGSLPRLAHAQIMIRPVAVTQYTHFRFETDLQEYRKPWLKLLGRGIANRSTHEVISIACLDTDCTQLTYLYFAPFQRKLYRFGRTIDAVLSPDHRLDEKATVQKIANDYHRMLAMNTFVTYQVLGRTDTQVMYEARQFKGSNFKSWNAFSGKIENSMGNTNDWNWSTRPISVSPRVFASFMHFADDLAPENSWKFYLNSIESVRDF